MLNVYRGYALKVGDWIDWNWLQHQVDKEDWSWLWSEGVALGLFRYGHIIKGAIIGMNRLAAVGHELVVVTHRPQYAVKDTIDWLSYARLPFSGVHILSNGEPKTTVDADILIDDKWDNVEEWALTGRNALLFDQSWNQRTGLPSSIRRVYGWECVVKELTQ